MLFKANGFVIYKAAIHRKVSNSPEPPDRPAPPPGPVAPAQLQAGRSTLEAGDVFPPKAPQGRSGSAGLLSRSWGSQEEAQVWKMTPRSYPSAHRKHYVQAPLYSCELVAKGRKFKIKGENVHLKTNSLRPKMSSSNTSNARNGTNLAFVSQKEKRPSDAHNMDNLKPRWCEPRPGDDASRLQLQTATGGAPPERVGSAGLGELGRKQGSGSCQDGGTGLGDARSHGLPLGWTDCTHHRPPFSSSLVNATQKRFRLEGQMNSFLELLVNNPQKENGHETVTNRIPAPAGGENHQLFNQVLGS